MICITLLTLSVISKSVISEETCNLYKFPTNFKFGAASSAYQIEGGWNADGKSPSWPDYIFNTFASVNGSIADDSYHLYREDVDALQSIGVDFYRFSISWPRILPKGFRTLVNQAGVDYYNNLLDALEDAGIEPLVTMFHWDTPLALTYLGDWSSRNMVDYFVEYADLLFNLFGSRVKYWATLNEPKSFCQSMPATIQQYFLKQIPIGSYEYLCTHHVLLAHAYTYRLYQKKYRRIQKGKVGIVLDLNDNIPYSNTTEDVEAAERANIFDVGWFAGPLTFGDYPQLIKDVVAKNSALQNFSHSRLPNFTLKEKVILKGSYDLFFLNHYTAELVTPAEFDITPSWVNDKQVTSSLNASWLVTNAGFSVYHPAFRNVLNYIKDNFKNPIIWITENGYSDSGGLNDTQRIEFIQGELEQVRLAMCNDNVKVAAYTYWSLLDSFEWNSGYSAKFGLVDVNFTTLERTLKESAYFYRDLVQSHLLTSSST